MTDEEFFAQEAPSLEKFRILCLKAAPWKRGLASKMPEALLTEEFCLKAVKTDGMELGSVPERFRTAAVCREACRQNAGAFEFVPEALKDDALCRYCISRCPSLLRFVPEGLKTDGLRVLAVTAARLAPDGEPGQDLDGWFARAAEQSGGWALEFVPERVKTPELCRKCFFARLDAGPIAFMPADVLEQLPDVCAGAIRRRPSMLGYVPEAARTPGMCLYAVSCAPETVRFVPDAVLEAMQNEEQENSGMCPCR